MSEAILHLVKSQHFGADDLAAIRKNVSEARAIMRTVMFAAESVRDGTMGSDSRQVPGGWCNVVGVVVGRLQAVRDVLMDTVNSPSLDWVTPLLMLEVTEAALWHSEQSAVDEPTIESAELRDVARVAIECLDEFAGKVGSVEFPSV